MQSATLCKVQAYAKCKIMQSANICKVQIYAKCFMQCVDAFVSLTKSTLVIGHRG